MYNIVAHQIEEYTLQGMQRNRDDYNHKGKLIEHKFQRRLLLGVLFITWLGKEYN